MEYLNEYEWPIGSKNKWFIMEHVGNFLEIKSFNRKHRELNSRTLNPDEKEELLSNNFITQIESTLKLKAVRDDEILDLMAKKYPKKFYLYCVIKNININPYAKNNSNFKNVKLKNGSAIIEYNRSIISNQKEKPYTITQDGYIFNNQKKPVCSCTFNVSPLCIISSRENESLVDKLLHQQQQLLRICESMIPSINVIDNRCMIKQDAQKKCEGEINMIIANRLEKDEGNKKTLLNCHHCGLQLSTNERANSTYVSCSKCQLMFHLSCLGISTRSLAAVKKYKWKCVECKICEKCRLPIGDMIFCDRCDRSYHSKCVKLDEIPLGRWICDKCGFCSSCCKRRPGSCGWITEKAKIGKTLKNIQIHCSNCSKNFRNGNYCIVCLEVFHDNNLVSENLKNDTNAISKCSICKNFVHNDCISISKKSCLICLGIVTRNFSYNEIIQ